MEKIVIKSYHTVCAIAGAKEDPAVNPNLDLTIDGTGFFLDNMTVLTANHVMKPNNTFILQGLPANQHQYIKIDMETIERFEDIDICLFRLKNSADNIQPLLLDPIELNMLDDVFTFGYPYAVNKAEGSLIHTRAFKGHIMSVQSRPRQIYELSFHCPRMLSGAPLVTTSPDGKLCLRGVILGNDISDTTVESTTQVEKDSNKEYFYERVESFHRGIALPSGVLASRFSKLLNAKIGDFLKNS